jgi:hypothetical protein
MENIAATQHEKIPQCEINFRVMKTHRCQPCGTLQALPDRTSQHSRAAP